MKRDYVQSTTRQPLTVSSPQSNKNRVRIERFLLNSHTLVHSISTDLCNPMKKANSYDILKVVQVKKCLHIKSIGSNWQKTWHYHMVSAVPDDKY